MPSHDAVRSSMAPTPVNAPQPSRRPRRGRYYAPTFALLTTLILGSLLYRILLPLFEPMLWAAFTAFLLHPTHRRLQRRLGGRRQISAFILTALTLVLVIGPLTAISAAFVSQANQLLQFVQTRLADPAAGDLLGATSVPWISDLLGWLDRRFGIDISQVQTWISQGSRATLQYLATFGGRVFMGALGTAAGFVLMIFMQYFFIRDGEELLRNTRDLIPMSTSHKRRLADHLASVARALVYGTGVVALVQGTLVGVAFLIVGLPSPLVFGALAVVASLFPFGGSALVWLPATLVLVAQQRWGAAIFMLAWGGLLVSLIDNILRPLLVSTHAKIGTLTIFMGVLGGLAAFGAIGLFLGPLVLALIIALLRFRLELQRAPPRP
jgi:predicted PurR-regulated permease PerM